MIACFVASAFEHKDVDAIYDRSIRPTLRELGIRCMRADRVEHNDDVDDKIFALMDTADFCIADLTYARPSVYYEAGYMFGCKKPVIYIARRDHFRAIPSDPRGILRVHFDLQMKNIISWSKPTSDFSARLKRRISMVIAPIIRAEHARRERAEYEAGFTRESISVQLALLKRFARETLEARGFSVKEKPATELWKWPNRLLSVHRTKRKIHQVINFLPVERLSKTQVPPDWVWSFRMLPEGVKAVRIERLLVYATLKRIADNVVRSLFPRFTPVAPFVLRNRIDELPLTTVLQRPEMPTILTVGVLPGIRSVKQFTESLPEILKLSGFE